MRENAAHHRRRRRPGAGFAPAEPPASRSAAALARTCRELESRLARTSAEYAQFVQSAAHDLQEPLHKIIAFGEMLERRLGKALDDQSRDYLERMRRAAQRQRRLIEDLLTLARVGTKGGPFEDADAAAIVRAAAADVAHGRRPDGCDIAIGTLPRVKADPVQLRQLFQLLLDNAVKFRRAEEPARVEVSGRDLGDGSCEIVVKDDGIGFDERYLDRIFKPFQRLHGGADYDGAGMGLAIAERIVARHDGTLRARSSPGRGASFIVRLPAAGIG